MDRQEILVIYMQKLAEFRVGYAALLVFAEVKTDEFTFQIKGDPLMKGSLFHDGCKIVCKTSEM